MKSGRPIVFAVLALALGLVETGCQGSALQKKMPWYTEDHVVGIKTADERIAEIDKLRDEQKKTPKSPEQQQKDCELLAREIEKEKQDPLVRRHILLALAVYPTALSGQVLKAGLSDPDFETRIACCRAWSIRGGKDGIEPLSNTLTNDGNFDVRLAAARALGTLKEPTAAKALAEALADADPAMQRRALESLKLVSGQDYGNDVTKWRQYAASPVGRGEEAVAAPPGGVSGSGATRVAGPRGEHACRSAWASRSVLLHSRSGPSQASAA